MSLLFIAGNLCATAAKTQTVCGTAEVNACTGARLNEDACLRLLHACGKYEEIIAHFKTEAMSSSADPAAWYYKGLAYHGLLVRSRSKAAICEYARATKQSLGTFFSLKQKADLESSERVFQQAYHSSRILEELQRITDCPEPTASDEEVTAVATNQGRAILEDLFIGDGPDGALGDKTRETKESFKTAIRKFATHAAAAQTQLELRQVAADECVRLANKVATVMTEHFGAIPSSSGGLTAPAESVLTELDVLYTQGPDGRQPAIVRFEAAIEAALGGCNIADYERARDYLVPIARQIAADSSLALQTLAYLERQSGNITSASGYTSAILSKQPDTRVIDNIEADWQAYGQSIRACSAIEKPWYCEQ